MPKNKTKGKRKVSAASARKESFVADLDHDFIIIAGGGFLLIILILLVLYR